MSIEIHGPVSDEIRQIPFEINPAFFPPPAIELPDFEVPPPSDFKYDFKYEHEAIAMYKKEQTKKEAETGNSSQPGPSAIDIISKVSYLSIATSNKQPSSMQKRENGITNSGVSMNVASSGISKTPTAADLLPTWKPPNLEE
ncbi:hypothetical protein FO519_006117 [Halicephalobus sp. NKZ332]|nr:hypothetical protein FO519_006117 [Halicephalobus sp. NKZ332]